MPQIEHAIAARQAHGPVSTGTPDGAAASAERRWLWARRRVLGLLPIGLTRHVRHAFTAWRDNGYPLPWGSGTLAVSGLFITIIVYAGTISGDFYTFTGALVQASDRALAHTGLAIEHIDVNGQEHLSKATIASQLAIQKNASLPLFDADKARQRLLDLPFVRSVTLQKFYPNRLKVIIREHEPFALWQHRDNLVVISRSGRILSHNPGIRYLDLPRIAGAGGNLHSTEILDPLARLPHISAEVSVVKRIAGRRWDVHFADGTLIKLPEEGIEAALYEWDRMRGKRIINHAQVASVDFRLPDRIVIRLTPEAAGARREAQAQRLRALQSNSTRARAL